MEGQSSLVRSLTIQGFSSGVSIFFTNFNRIEDCWIGPDGSPNHTGVRITDFSFGNTIGGTTVAQRNVISNNTSSGVFFSTETDSNEIIGNYIGTDPTGTQALPNHRGVSLEADTGDLIGGATVTPGDPPGNLISGNTQYGLSSWGAPWGYARGNLIGTDATGSAALPNAADGAVPAVELFAVAFGHLIGNVISGNGGVGLHVQTLDGGGLGPISGNFIGTDRSGTAPLPNGGDGVELGSPSVGEIGGLTGATAGACTGNCNVIAHNGGAGVRVEEGIRWSVVGNSIHSNAGLGIDIDPVGHNPNDPQDPDDGPNRLQNHPVVTYAEFNGSFTTVMGEASGVPGSVLEIDIYANSVGDPADAEGELWLGRTTASPGPTPGLFGLLVPGDAGYLTATATDQDGNTSEFSPGYCNPGEATDLLASRGAGSTVDVGFLPAAGATDHAIYLGTAGPTAMSGPPVWTSSFCALGVTGTASFDPGDPAPGFFFHFLPAGQRVGSEGSYGRDSSSAERAEAGAVGGCDLPQALTLVCP